MHSALHGRLRTHRGWRPLSSRKIWLQGLSASRFESRERLELKSITTWSVAVRLTDLPGRTQDRVFCYAEGKRAIIVLADGAGNSRASGLVAEGVIQQLVQRWRSGGLADEAQCREALCEADASAMRVGAGGESTAVVVLGDGDRVWGASVGDSEAWALRDCGWLDLTEYQHRKPLLGSGVARPVSFQTYAIRRILLGSDGLFRATPLGRILEVAERPGSAELLLEEIEARVRGQSRLSETHDDVSMVIAELSLCIAPWSIDDSSKV